jgi:glycosyltransferase involved in cell wall biosynthesis
LKKTYARLKRADPAISCRVLTRSRSGDPAEEVADGFAIKRLKLSGESHMTGFRPFKALRQAVACVSDVRAASAYLDAIDPKSIDVVHTGGWSWLVFAACLWARRHGVPLVRELTSAADGPTARGLGGVLVRRTLDWSSLIVAISPLLGKACENAGYLGKLWCRPNPVDANEFFPVASERKCELRRELFKGAVPPEARLILYVGHICPWKNQKFLIGVLQKLPEDCRLALVGPAEGDDRDYLASIRAEAECRGVASRLHVIDRNVDRVPDYMRAADTTAFPSLAEGLGNVVLESLMCGVPVASHRIEDVTSWIVREGDNGALSALEAESFASAVMRVFSLKPRAASVAADAALRFSAAAIDAEYLKRFRDLLHEGSPR